MSQLRIDNGGVLNQVDDQGPDDIAWELCCSDREACSGFFGFGLGLGSVGVEGALSRATGPFRPTTVEVRP